MVFAFITVVITVHAYVFYSIYVVNGDSLRQAVGTNSVLAAVRNNRRNLHVRPRHAGLVCSSGWILFCLFYGMRLRKPAFIPSCLQKLWSQNNTSSPFWNSHNLCNSRPNVRSIAASRLAQNAPLEHFAGLQPSLPRFLQWVWLQLSFTILTTMDSRFMSLWFSGCASCVLISLLPFLLNYFLFSLLYELSSSWFLREILRNRFRNSRGGKSSPCVAHPLLLGGRSKLLTP